MGIKNLILAIPPIRTLYARLNNQHVRDVFVKAELQKLPAGSLILDAGCGSQRYRGDCAHLAYKAQDFGQYSTDEKPALSAKNETPQTYQYGALDYVGDIWAIAEKDATFDAIMCTEVLEHIPYPAETLKEFSRLLRPGGTLILTAPSNCLRHFDPYFFSSGYSDRWYQKFLGDTGMTIRTLEPVGDYFSWMAVEIARTAKVSSILSRLFLLPIFLYYMGRKKTEASVNALCMGYHVVATKRSDLA